MVVTLDAKRRLTVPAALAPAKPGDYFDARFDAEEDAIVCRSRCFADEPGSKITPNHAGLIDGAWSSSTR
jgi:hypothetical protein